MVSTSKYIIFCYNIIFHLVYSIYTYIICAHYIIAIINNIIINVFYEKINKIYTISPLLCGHHIAIFYFHIIILYIFTYLNEHYTAPIMCDFGNLWFIQLSMCRWSGFGCYRYTYDIGIYYNKHHV